MQRFVKVGMLEILRYKEISVLLYLLLALARIKYRKG